MTTLSYNRFCCNFQTNSTFKPLITFFLFLFIRSSVVIIVIISVIVYNMSVFLFFLFIMNNTILS